LMSSNAKLSLVAAIMDERLLRELGKPSPGYGDAFEICRKDSTTWRRFASRPKAIANYFDDATLADLGKSEGAVNRALAKALDENKTDCRWFARQFDVRKVQKPPVERSGLLFECTYGGLPRDCPFDLQEPEAFAPLMDGVAAIHAYNEAVAIMKGADLDNLNLIQSQAKLHLETNRTKLCACCRYSANERNQKSKGTAELRACLDGMKDECIGKKCAICDKKFVREDKPIIEFDHIDQDTKEFQLSDLRRIAQMGLGVAAMELERAKCDRTHMSCHRQRTFLQLMGLDDHAIPFDEETLELIAARRRPAGALKMRRKLAIGICACGCKKKVTKRNYMCFDFAHTPGKGDIQKVNHVSHMHKIGEIDAEIAKCNLLFCECHKKQETDPGRVSWKNKIAAGL